MTVKELKEALNDYPDNMLVSTPIWSSLDYDMVHYVCKRERSTMEYSGLIDMEEISKYPYKDKDNKKITVIELEGDYA